MSDQLCDVVRSASQISVQDVVVSTTSAKESIIPCNSTDPPVVAFQGLDNFRLCRIPNLEIPCMSSNCEMVTVARPLNTCDSVIRTNVA